jgi:hypothetical protein
MNTKNYLISFLNLLVGIIILIVFISCDNTDDTLAPYVGPPKVSGLQIEAKSYTPKITWIGGYVTVLGINRGSSAALDNSLVWLIYKSGNDIHYPVQYGQLPIGVQDLTSQYGGSSIPELIEDSTYTIWVLKEDVWTIITANPGKIITLDSALTQNYLIAGDTIKLSASVHTQKTQNLDNYLNIYEITTFGRLGAIGIKQTNTSNNPKISWTITQPEVTDTLIAAIGIADGSQYSSSASIWEAYSEVTQNDTLFYGKHNVISSPLIAGQSFNDTKIFVEYPLDGLQRNKTYYVWIANKNWDGVGRLRSTQFYAYATFKTR